MTFRSEKQQLIPTAKEKKLSFGASSTSKDDKPLFGNTNGFSFRGAGKTEDKEDAKETNTTDIDDQQGGFGSTGGFSFGNSANPEDKQPKSGTDEKKEVVLGVALVLIVAPIKVRHKRSLAKFQKNRWDLGALEDLGQQQ